MSESEGRIGIANIENIEYRESNLNISQTESRLALEFCNFENILYFFQLILTSSLMFLEIDNYSSLSNKIPNHCLLIQHFVFIILTLRYLSILGLTKIYIRIMEIFFIVIYLLLTFSFLKYFFNKYMVLDSFINQSLSFKNVVEILIAIIGLYKSIVELTKLSVIVFYIIVLLLNQLKIVKGKLKGYAEKETEEKLKLIMEEPYKMNCMICLEDIDFKNYSEYMRLKCHSSHIFHNKCLIVWCQEKISCPLCKKRIF